MHATIDKNWKIYEWPAQHGDTYTDNLLFLYRMKGELNKRFPFDSSKVKAQVNFLTITMAAFHLGELDPGLFGAPLLTSLLAQNVCHEGRLLSPKPTAETSYFLIHNSTQTRIMSKPKKTKCVIHTYATQLHCSYRQRFWLALASKLWHNVAYQHIEECGIHFNGSNWLSDRSRQFLGTAFFFFFFLKLTSYFAN